jgi:nitrogen fixation protein FixH
MILATIVGPLVETVIEVFAGSLVVIVLFCGVVVAVDLLLKFYRRHVWENSSAERKYRENGGA